LGEEEEDAIRIKHLVAAVCNGTDDSNSIVANMSFGLVLFCLTPLLYNISCDTGSNILSFNMFSPNFSIKRFENTKGVIRIR
jgi:hypothetical protein